MVPVEDMMQFMTADKKMSEAAVTPYRASLFLKVLDKPTLVEYAGKHPIYHSTVGATEVLYTPAGFAVVEHSSQAGDIA
eukprot:6490653-Lingulodinium_polyedra.AAC.1